MKRLLIPLAATLTFGLVGAAAAVPTAQVGVKPHTGCESNDRRDYDNQWCVWIATQMHDGQGDRHDHSGWFGRDRTWHRTSNAVARALCERKCHS